MAADRLQELLLKDPAAVLDYAIEWAEWLPPGDTLTGSTWTAETGIDITDDTQFSQTRAVVWLSGGTAGTKYRVTNHVTTSGGRQDERTLLIQVVER